MSRTVVVAGAGPTGLMLACELALAGVRTIVVEPRTEPPGVSQGMAIHGRTLEAFRQRGLAERIPPGTAPAWPRTPFALLWLDLAAVGEQDHTYVFPQWRTERLLAEHAEGLGVTILRGRTVVGVGQDDLGVSVTVRAADGAEETLRCAYAVGCDGERSAVRDLAGIAFPEEGMPYYGVMGDVELAPGADAPFESGVFPAGMSSAIPLRPGLVRLMTVEFGVQCPDPSVPVTADELRASIERITGTAVTIGDPGWVSRFGNHTRLAGAYRNGRVFVAGDAAHVLFVSGTQGLNAGIQDAVNLGWKLAAAVHGWAPPGLLDTYEAERRPFGERICVHARAQMSLLHPVHTIAELRGIFAGLLRSEAVNRYLLEMSTKDTPPGLGDRITDLPLTAAGGVATPGELLRGGRAVLLDASAGGLDLTAAKGWADRLDVVGVEPAEPLVGAAVLLRPDGYVAALVPAGGDPGGLWDALAAWLGAPEGDGATNPRRWS